MFRKDLKSDGNKEKRPRWGSLQCTSHINALSHYPKAVPHSMEAGKTERKRGTSIHSATWGFQRMNPGCDSEWDGPRDSFNYDTCATWPVNGGTARLRNSIWTALLLVTGLLESQMQRWRQRGFINNDLCSHTTLWSLKFKSQSFADDEWR